jgi:hypothetical protein
LFRCKYLLRIHESSEISRRTTSWHVDQRLAVISAIGGRRVGAALVLGAAAAVNARRFMALNTKTEADFSVIIRQVPRAPFAANFRMAEDPGGI